MKQIQIVFLGAEKVGKTSTINQFLYGSFQDKTDATLGHCYSETVFLPNGIFQNVKIVDTAGSDEFPAMRRVNIKNGDYLVVMYAVDNRQSLDQALNLCQEIREIKGKDFNRIILVGNKIDKKDTREITTEEVLRKSISEGILWCTETSAKLNCNIRCLFQIILQDYVISYDLYGKSDKGVSKYKTNTKNSIMFKSKKLSVQNLVYSICSTTIPKNA
ncbi:GTP-binding protein Di-Ras2-like [Crassostrea angulata]|uniref:GTP-binding protein Di-Ras2-like n=1 Tax=Magallana angulata TaxID=2784310 RepID=UPI0022B0B5E6|nr:GTP-binding protein Di-Ras2-like [Crassostrea angulata]